MSKVIDVYYEVHMSASHASLRKLRGDELESGQYALFINRAWTACKMLTPDNVILYLRRPANRPIDPDAIKYLPACVGGGNLNYDKALEASIKRRWKGRTER